MANEKYLQQFKALKLKINKWLHVARFDLNNEIDEDNRHGGFSKDRDIKEFFFDIIFNSHWCEVQ